MKKSNVVNDTSGMILGLLALGSRTGGEVCRFAETRYKFFHITRSQVYRELRVMRQKGLVRNAQAKDNVESPFSLTTRGRKALDAWLKTEGKVIKRDGVKLREHLRRAVA